MNRNRRTYLTVTTEFDELVRVIETQKLILKWQTRKAAAEYEANYLASIYGDKELRWMFFDPEDTGDYLLGKQYITHIEEIQFCEEKIAELNASINL